MSFKGSPKEEDKQVSPLKVTESKSNLKQEHVAVTTTSRNN